MPLKQLGSHDPVTESVQVDRVGFVTASVRKIYPAPEIINEVPPPPFDEVLGAKWTRTTVESDAGVATVRWLYEGIKDDKKAVYLYEWQTSLETVPIQAHPSYKSWLGVYGTEDAAGNWKPYRNNTGQVASSTGKGLASGGSSQLFSGRNPLLGVESFYSIGGVWTRRYGSREIPKEIMNGIGSIYVDVPGPCPGLPSGRNWLKGAPQMTWRGNAWDITEQYILSGRGGWSLTVYNGQTE
jgi:hypothetical protein